MAVEEGRPLDRALCLMLVVRYLLAQNWRLADPAEMVEAVWPALVTTGNSHLTGRPAVDAVFSQVWQHYAALLHDGCCQNQPAAWDELDHWLRQQAGRWQSDQPEQERLVQETLLKLQQKLHTNPLDAPRAFFYYAIETLRHQRVDMHRRRTAARRREDYQLSLEATAEAEPDHLSWDEVTAGTSGRETEAAVASEQIRRQLRLFFQAHLHSAGQQQVAEMHFLDDLSLAEIARILGKQPHEIRQVKARLVQKLRELPPAAQQQLADILGRYEEMA